LEAVETAAGPFGPECPAGPQNPVQYEAAPLAQPDAPGNPVAPVFASPEIRQGHPDAGDFPGFHRAPVDRRQHCFDQCLAGPARLDFRLALVGRRENCFDQCLAGLAHLDFRLALVWRPVGCFDQCLAGPVRLDFRLALVWRPAGCFDQFPAGLARPACLVLAASLAASPLRRQELARYRLVLA